MHLRKEHSYLVNLIDDFCGKTALHVAIQYGDVNIVGFLLSQGANINKQDEEGQTPLFIAARKKREDMVILLLKQGADPAISDKRGATPLDIAKSGYASEVIEVIETYIADQEQVRLSTED